MTQPSEPTISAVQFRPDPMNALLAGITAPGAGSFDVHVTLTDGTSCTAFSFYNDELSFSDSELLGLTVEQARQLRLSKDVAYLRS